MNSLRSVTNARVKHLHFVGIGGSGMSGIAEVLHNLDYVITGSDITPSKTTDRLQALGISIVFGHQGANVAEAQAVVISSAIKDNNPEVKYAKKHHIPVVPRAEMLSELMRFRYGIAVAGTHGKTTTTSLIAHVLSSAELDPTYIIGGILNSSGIGAKLGESDYLIAEADESDASFLHLQPMLSVITNIDQDHMSTYDDDVEKLKSAFVNFAANLPFYGCCVACLEDENLSQILDQIHRPITTYGFGDQADLYATNIKQSAKQMHFDVVSHKYNKQFSVSLNLIGRHNVLNTLAAIGICLELDISPEIIQTSLSDFHGVARRLDCHGQIKLGDNNLTLFDDYGHHPNEILAVIDSLRQSYPEQTLSVIFQPHRYSRTRDLFDDFAQVLSQVDELILLDVYAAGEKPIARINTRTLAEAIRKRSEVDPVVVKDAKSALEVLPHMGQHEGILLTLGAGDIHHLVPLIKTQFSAC